MPKVLIDQVLIHKFLTRGVDSIYPSKDELEKLLMSGKRLKVYQGFDPTGPYLHVGHAMGIRALRILQQLGHEVIFLVGDYTAKVGDPDPTKLGARPILSDEQIEKNCQGWRDQAGQLIDFEGDNPVLFKHNFEWLSKLTLNDLIKLMSHATVQQMVERDLFQKRIKENTPIQLQEFIYPLMQGFDSVAMGVDIEIGGTDQVFNMLTGRDLVRKYLGKEKFVRSNEMMEAPEGKTMSKTKGNGINLADTPENMYGKAMSYPDALITKGLRLLTDISIEDITGIDRQIRDGENPMKFKKLTAFEIVKSIKGEKLAEKAQMNFERTVQNKDITQEDTVEVRVSGTMPLSDFLTRALSEIGENQSVSQIKRVVEQGGVELDGKKLVEAGLPIHFKSGDVIKFGKRRYIRVKSN